MLLVFTCDAETINEGVVHVVFSHTLAESGQLIADFSKVFLWEVEVCLRLLEELLKNLVHRISYPPLEAS